MSGLAPKLRSITPGHAKLVLTLRAVDPGVNATVEPEAVSYEGVGAFTELKDALITGVLLRLSWTVQLLTPGVNLRVLLFGSLMLPFNPQPAPALQLPDLARPLLS